MHLSAHIVPLLLLPSSVSCAPKAIGQRGLDDWKCHCESHLANLDTLPYQCGSLIYANTLAAPGLCFWCLSNENFAPILRLQRFLHKTSWQSHIEKEHLAELTGCEVLTCPHPKCTGSFDTQENRVFHLHDVHCWEPRKPKSGIKRGRSCQKGERSGDSKKRPHKRRRVTLPRPGTFEFVEQSGLFGESKFRLVPALTLMAMFPSRTQTFSAPGVCDASDGHLGWGPFIQLCVIDPQCTISFS